MGYMYSISRISPKDFSFETEIAFTMNGKYLKVKNMKLKIFLRALDVSNCQFFIFSFLDYNPQDSQMESIFNRCT